MDPPPHTPDAPTGTNDPGASLPAALVGAARAVGC